MAEFIFLDDQSDGEANEREEKQGNSCQDIEHIHNLWRAQQALCLIINGSACVTFARITCALRNGAFEL